MPAFQRVFVTLIAICALTALCFLPTVRAAGSSGATPKVCHECETVGPQATPTLPSCGPFCKERQEETALPTAAGSILQTEYEAGVVKILFFWMEGCPHCVETKNETLPALRARFGDALHVREVELVSVSDVDALYRVATSRGLSASQVGVPMVMIGAETLVGSNDMQARLPALVEKYRALGGVGYPLLPELQPGSQSGGGITPTAALTFTPTSAVSAARDGAAEGNLLSRLILFGVLLAVGVGLRVFRRLKGEK